MDRINIDDVNLFAYRIPTKLPLKVKNSSVEERRGFLVRFTTDMGDSAFGEIAPLSGLHHEKYNQIPEMIKTFVPQLWRRKIPGVDQYRHFRHLPPIIRFGLESALFSLETKQKLREGRDPWDSVQPSIDVNALFDPSVQLVDDILTKIEAEGYRCIKIKTGRLPVEQDIEVVNQLCEGSQSVFRIRIDSNRKWSLNTAIRFYQSVSHDRIDYFEEPLMDPSQLPELYAKTGIPIALDESLLEGELNRFVGQKWVHTFVIKPTLCGAFQETLQLMDQTDRLGQRVVISDTFHSGVGLSIHGILAARKRRFLPAAGLDTYSWLNDQLLNNPLDVGSTLPVIQSWQRAQDIDLTQLEKVL